MVKSLVFITCCGRSNGEEEAGATTLPPLPPENPESQAGMKFGVIAVLLGVPFTWLVRVVGIKCLVCCCATEIEPDAEKPE